MKVRFLKQAQVMGRIFNPKQEVDIGPHWGPVLIRQGVAVEVRPVEEKPKGSDPVKRKRGRPRKIRPDEYDRRDLKAKP